MLHTNNSPLLQVQYLAMFPKEGVKANIKLFKKKLVHTDKKLQTENMDQV